MKGGRFMPSNSNRELLCRPGRLREETMLEEVVELISDVMATSASYTMGMGPLIKIQDSCRHLCCQHCLPV